MNFKSLFKFGILMVSPLMTFALDCINENNIDTDACRADILVITVTGNDNDKFGYESVTSTLETYKINYLNLEVPQTGITDNEIDRILYTVQNGIKFNRFKVVVFPNGRVSYNEGGDIWKSAIKQEQWDKFYDYSRSFNTRLVFLNEYPSNHTSTEVVGVYTGEEAAQKYQITQTIIPEPGIAEEESIRNSNLKTTDIWHFPARIVNNMNNVEAEPLLYFSECLPDYPEKSVAAVTVNNNGAYYAAFFMAFGKWSSDSTSLNIIWLSWATDKDFKFLSGSQISTEDALKQSSGIDKITTLNVIFVTLTTLFTLLVTLF